MQILNAKQGTPEWLAHRLKHHNASDAPAMMGCSKYKTRSQLVQECATGLGDDVSPETQRLYDAGHAYEALARPLAEKIVGEDLYPVTGYDGNLSASFDGLTLDDRIAWEHKSLNDALRAILPVDGVGADGVGAALPLMYRVQMEQQALVSGCERVLFTASKWHGEDCIDARHCWYRPDHVLRAQLVAGWLQFEADVAAYQPGEVAPVVVAEPVQALPAVVVKVTGEIAITANFSVFETAFRDFVADRLITEPKTDQDFADLDLQIKAMKGAEAALDSAESQMLAQITSVDAAKKTKDMLYELVRKHRLASEKLLESEKQRRKAEIVADGQAKLREHIAALSKRLGLQMPLISADIAGVIKGKKSLASMEDAIGAELARAKIEANRVADLIDANRAAMDAADAAGLFPDFAQVCTKPADDFTALIAARRAAAQERLERERERIRAEEAARLEREQREAAEAKAREEAAAQARAEAEAKAKADAEARAAQREEAMRIERENDSAAAKRTSLVDYVPPPAPAPEVRTFTRTAAPAVLQTEQYTVLLGHIQKRLAPIQVTAEGLAQLGFPYRSERGLKLYLPSDFAEICERISQHVLKLAAEAKQAA